MTRPTLEHLPKHGRYRVKFHDEYCIRNADDEHRVVETGFIVAGKFEPDPELVLRNGAVTASEPVWPVSEAEELKREGDLMSGGGLSVD